jgi:hypothetical protein
MNPGPPARWRQLALLTVAVLAVHAALLQPGVRTLAPQRPAQESMPFVTRSLAPPAPRQVELAPPVQELRAPAPVAPRRIAAPTKAREPPSPRAAAALPSIPLTAPITAWPSAILHYELTVRSRGLTSEGTARLEWQKDGNRYEAQLALALPGLRERVQQSRGEIGAEGLVPERFSDRLRSEQATHFDRASGRVVFSNNQPQVDWVAGMQDRLSVLLQLAMLAAAQPTRFTPGTQVVLPTATTREADEWVFHVRGEEDLDLPGGAVRALKLERLPRREYDQRLELWLSPGQAYAPVRLRLTNPDGGWVDQRWSSTDRR